MIPRMSYKNSGHNSKTHEGANYGTKTLASIGKRTQSMEQKLTFQDKRLSSVMRNRKTSTGVANHKPQIRKSIIDSKLDSYNLNRGKSKRVVMPQLNDYGKKQLQARNSVAAKRDSVLTNTSTESFMSRLSVQNEFPKVRPQLHLQKGPSHANISPIYSTKHKPIQPARSSTFALANGTATYAVNTTNGLIRNYNEDRVSIVVNIKRKTGWTSWPNCSYFAVFDGHGGSICADYLKDHLHQFILDHPKFPSDPVRALKEGFDKAEAEFCAWALKQTNVDRSGSCALILLFVDNILYTANVGDCRAIVSENNGKLIAPLTRDHKPEEPSEQERIMKNGGQVSKSSLWHHHNLTEQLKERMVELPYRVYPGGLSVSRSFGDVTAKNTELGGNSRVLIATPDIRTYRLEPGKTDFIMFGCKLRRRWYIR